MTGENIGLWNEYELLAKLRSDGDQGYHSLTATHVTANSLLIAAITVLRTVKCDKTEIEWIIIALCVAGICLIVQMWEAQRVFSTKNSFWTCRLIQLEKNGLIAGGHRLNYFCEMERARKKKKRWYIPRMRAFPFIFFMVYIILLIPAVLPLAPDAATFAKNILTEEGAARFATVLIVAMLPIILLIDISNRVREKSEKTIEVNKC